LVRSEIAEFSGPKTVPVRHQDHRRVAMAAPIGARALDQLVDLAGREVLASADAAVLRAAQPTVRISRVGVIS
jgi:hypothetical protein